MKRKLESGRGGKSQKRRRECFRRTVRRLPSLGKLWRSTKSLPVPRALAPAGPVPMPPAPPPLPAKNGEQVLAEARAKEEAKARNVWLHAWHDPVAGLKAYSPCVRLADISADGESKLLVAGSDCKLRIFKGTSLVSENVLLDAPVSICVFFPDANKPRVPSVAVAAGAFVFIYRNLRPYYKFSLPMLVVNEKERDLWSSLGEGRVSIDEAKLALAGLRDSGVGLTSRSQDLLGLDEPAAVDAFVAEHNGVPLAQQTACTCMEVLKRDSEEVHRPHAALTPPSRRPHAALPPTSHQPPTNLPPGRRGEHAGDRNRGGAGPRPRYD